MKGYYKVPFRQVFCATLRLWLAETLLCHVYYRLAPADLPTIPPQRK